MCTVLTLTSGPPCRAPPGGSSSLWPRRRSRRARWRCQRTRAASCILTNKYLHSGSLNVFILPCVNHIRRLRTENKRIFLIMPLLSQIHVTKTLAVVVYLQTVLVQSQVRVSWPGGCWGQGLVWQVDTGQTPQQCWARPQPHPLNVVLDYDMMGRMQERLILRPRE